MDIQLVVRVEAERSRTWQRTGKRQGCAMVAADQRNILVSRTNSYRVHDAIRDYQDAVLDAVRNTMRLGVPSSLLLLLPASV